MASVEIDAKDIAFLALALVTANTQNMSQNLVFLPKIICRSCASFLSSFGTF